MDERPSLDSTKLAAARLKAATAQPFLSVALYALSPCSAPGLGTFAVDDRWRLFLDPQQLNEWSVDEVAGVLLHEVGHLVRHHSARGKSVFVDEDTALLWNVAGDAEINDDLLHDGLRLPSGAVTPQSLKLPRNRSAESYFSALLERRGFVPPFVHCGTGATGLDDHTTVDVARLPAGVDVAEAELIRRRVAVEISMARGSVPAGWVRWADGFVDPKIDWRRALAARLRGSLAELQAGRVDYSYARPSRRHVPRVVLPSLVRPSPVVAVVLDTSASVDGTMLEQAWAETLAMVTAVGVRRDRLRVWATDAAAVQVRTTRSRVALAGGGGTDMRVGIAAATRERPRADLVVVLTDGETPWPSAAPVVPVVVGLLRRRGRSIGTVPAWASAIEIPVD